MIQIDDLIGALPVDSPWRETRAMLLRLAQNASSSGQSAPGEPTDVTYVLGGNVNDIQGMKIGPFQIASDHDVREGNPVGLVDGKVEILTPGTSWQGDGRTGVAVDVQDGASCMIQTSGVAKCLLDPETDLGSLWNGMRVFSSERTPGCVRAGWPSGQSHVYQIGFLLNAGQVDDGRAVVEVATIAHNYEMLDISL